MKALLPILLGCALLGGASPGRCAEPRAGRSAINTFTDEEEAIIGDSMAKKFEAKNPVLRNSLAEGYLGDIVQQLAAKSQRPDVRYEVRILNTHQINAFSLPGAHVYVTLGLLEFADSEGEMVSALSHEVGHVVGRHMMERISRLAVAQAVLKDARARGIRLTGQLSDRIATEGVNVVYSLLERSFDRDEEREADLYGFYQMGRAGWDPQAAIALLDRFNRISRSGGALEKILATHPEPGDRAERLRGELGEVLLSRDMRNDSLQFQAMKAAIRFLR